ncbi:hypothetical protein [Alkalihalobacillus trypoxylicola]|uniref:Pyrroline-5-carboxylate reductase catalytic N-terminal domain-containing protein n=1 Tax=Alkalihalobacillus trypoxylicola TaxID=519424 RepID=A0A162CU59_9BACI|nr:hypothetical protein [Alkalihalobacillus trypoxylicola]KYG26656.1 hypothetical protein AZF04_12685 [Alkalihalobacillus trypoxylicola]
MNVMVGSGKLAHALLTFWNPSVPVYLYGRNDQTIAKLIQKFPFVKQLNEHSFYQIKNILLCIPSQSYRDFFKKFEATLNSEVNIYHFATALMKSDVQKWSKKWIIPCKVVGHALEATKQKRLTLALPKDEWSQKEKLVHYFQSIKIVMADEKQVLKSNQIGTEMALKAIISLEEKWKQEELPSELYESVLSQVLVGVMKAHYNNEHGSFAKKILHKLKEEQ